MVSAVVDGTSHWFNRLRVEGQDWDFDLTGDQFGLPSVQIAPSGELYPQTRMRRWEELDAETLRRLRIFSQRVRLSSEGLVACR
jgi:hypothetical protein